MTTRYPKKTKHNDRFSQEKADCEKKYSEQELAIEWNRFAINICQNSFVRRKLFGKQKRRCKNCTFTSESSLLNSKQKQDVHHLTYDHICSSEHPPIRDQVPDCEACFNTSPYKFRKCLSKLQLLHHDCHTHLHKKEAEEWKEKQRNLIVISKPRGNGNINIHSWRQQNIDKAAHVKPMSFFARPQSQPTSPITKNRIYSKQEYQEQLANKTARQPTHIKQEVPAEKKIRRNMRNRTENNRYIELYKIHAPNKLQAEKNVQEEQDLQRIYRDMLAWTHEVKRKQEADRSRNRLFWIVGISLILWFLAKS